MEHPDAAEIRKAQERVILDAKAEKVAKILAEDPLFKRDRPSEER